MMKILKLPKVLELTSLSRSSVYQHISQGSFPRQVKIGERSVGWVEEEILAWVSSRIEQRGVAK